MKQNLYRLLFLTVTLLYVSNAFAGFFEESKTYKFSYRVGEKPSVEINNQYGEVSIVSWEKDTVKIEAIITATSDKLDDISKLLGRVEVTCRGTESSVLASTEWTEASNFFTKGMMDLSKIINSDKKLTINYKVYLPANSRLTINNRFGDVYLPDYKGALRVDLSHGDLRARNIADGRSIAVKYGKVIIKSLESGLLKIEYGNLILDKSGFLTLESKSSTLEILEVKALSIKSKNDELRIDKVESLRGDATFTHLLVKRLSKMANINTNYGDVFLKEIGKDFDLIRLIGVNTDYDMEFIEGSVFQFDIFTIKEKGFVYAPSPTTMNEEELKKDEKRYKGFYGSETAKSKVSVNQKNGVLNWFVR